MSLVSKQCFKQLRIGKCCRNVPRIAVTRNVHASPSPAFSLTLPTVEALHLPTLSLTVETRENVQRERLEHLVQALDDKSSDPTRIWRHYRLLLNVEHPGNIALEVHQHVLRRCCPSPREMRAIFADHLRAKASPAQPHAYEYRYQTIIRNMQRGGYTPSVEDYHYVLAQFAAIGFRIGTFRVKKEIEALGLSKTTKTYTLCLLSLCRAMMLPIEKKARPEALKSMSAAARELLDEMWMTGIPITPINVDLAVRVLKESLDMESLDKVLKVAYGIDLSFPDRPPVEFWDRARPQSKAADLIPPLPRPLPFGTAALNTTLDVLGRLGEVSKMVQLFEVVTNPLPEGVQIPSSSFDDEDDFGYNNPSVSSLPLPHTQPNTTTFYTLIRWLAEADHTILTRHYFLHFYHYEREVDHQIRKERVKKRDRQPIYAPRVSMNRNILQAVFGLANRNKNRNVDLLIWIWYKVLRTLKNKRKDLEFYRRWQEMEAAKHQFLIPEHPTADGTRPLPASESSSSPATTASPVRPDVGETDTHQSEVDVETPSEPPKPPRQRLIDIDLHVSLIKRDLDEIAELEKRVRDVVARNIQRMKERLGRRVWTQKNVFLRFPEGRQLLSKDHWREIVNFDSIRRSPQEENNGVNLGGPLRRRIRWQKEKPNFRRSRRGLMTWAGRTPLERHT